MTSDAIAIAAEDIKKGELVRWCFATGHIIKYTPPPKTYTFAEAYAMMKQGKRMKCINTGQRYWLKGSDIMDMDSNARTKQHGSYDAAFSRAMIDGDWEESPFPGEYK